MKKRAALLLGLTVFLILFLLQPFGEVIHGFTLMGILRVGSYALTTGLVIWVCELYLIKYFRLLFGSGAFYLPVLWYAFEIVLASSLIFLCKNTWAGFAYWNWPDYVIVLQRSLSIAIFPLTLLFLFLLGQKRRKGRLQLSASGGSEFLSVDEEDLLFLQSEDNYTSVFHLQNGEVKRRILRGSLSSFEEQLTFPFIRSHRSYVINLAVIESAKGNSQGYQITLRHYDQDLKVSRKYTADFNTAWETFLKQNK